MDGDAARIEVSADLVFIISGERRVAAYFYGSLRAGGHAEERADFVKGKGGAELQRGGVVCVP